MKNKRMAAAKKIAPGSDWHEEKLPAASLKDRKRSGGV
jgi:hypothetical protein